MGNWRKALHLEVKNVSENSVDQLEFEEFSMLMPRHKQILPYKEQGRGDTVLQYIWMWLTGYGLM